MRKSLYLKLALAFILVAFISASLVVVFIRVTSQERLAQLVMDQQISAMEQVLVDYYTFYGSWDGIDLNWQQLQYVTAASVSPGTNDPIPGNMRPEFRGRWQMFGLANADDVVLVAVDPEYPEGSKLSEAGLAEGTPVMVNNIRVGTLLISRQQLDFNPEESRFLERTYQALTLAIGVALLVALVIGILLARTLTRPLKALTLAAQNITRGQLEQQVAVKSKDEIGQLATAFNSMSQEVARVNQLRRQMTADIAHDLRTPLTVIAGYVESMRDEVLQPTPERLALIYAEIERLQNLVGDLRMLSQVDAGELPLNPQLLSPRDLLERAAALFQHQAEQQNITLKMEAEDTLPQVKVDEARMMQVLANLLSNSFRFTPAGGSILLSAHAVKEGVRISVEDTGSGIAPEDLPQIFQRFHRADKSRHAESGETGLGLAIVRALVEAQGGRVWAESVPQQGTTIHLEFPA
jgi:signal transduction histidine kinase